MEIPEFKNTKELEKYHFLDNCPPNSKIHIIGGLDDSKYNAARYLDRTTYTANELNSFISQMKKIEEAVEPGWSKLQIAYFAHKVLAGYISYYYDYKENHDKASNLSGLISKKSVCAGYALIYKELMDRLNIPCDYIRGHAGNELHAWNTLLIDNKAIAVDLTWDSIGRHNDPNSLPVYFGSSSAEFYSSHEPDSDEYRYNYFPISKDELAALDKSICTDEKISEHPSSQQAHQPSQPHESRKMSSPSLKNQQESFPAKVIERTSGSKVAVAQCGSMFLENKKIYKYVIAECVNGKFESPKIIYSEDNLKSMSSYEAQNFASILLEPKRLKKYFEHCEDDLANSPDQNELENHGGYIGHLSNGIKEVDSSIFSFFPNNFSTMHRFDRSSFILQSCPRLRISDKLNLMRYDAYEIINKNGQPTLVHDSICSEQDLRNLPTSEQQCFAASTTLARHMLDKNSRDSSGYVGYIARNQEGNLEASFNDEIKRILNDYYIKEEKTR